MQSKTSSQSTRNGLRKQEDNQEQPRTTSRSTVLDQELQTTTTKKCMHHRMEHQAEGQTE